MHAGTCVTGSVSSVCTIYDPIIAPPSTIARRSYSVELIKEHNAWGATPSLNTKTSEIEKLERAGREMLRKQAKCRKDEGTALIHIVIDKQVMPSISLMLLKLMVGETSASRPSSNPKT